MSNFYVILRYKKNDASILISTKEIVKMGFCSDVYFTTE